MKKNYSSTKFLFLFFIGLFGLVNAKVQAQCQANFVYNVGPNGVVYFNNASTAGAQDTISSYFWSFGNNQFATIPNPIQTFPNAGVYDVCLIIFTTNNNCGDTICQQISVPSANCNLMAAIASDSIAGTMTAIATLGTLPYTYQWSNGSTQQVINPVTVGNYCVTVTDAMGCTSNACYFWDGISCNYGYTFNYGTQGAVNFFTAGTNGQPVTWDFGDGTTQITTAATFFSHTYTQSGNYYVCISMPGCIPYCASVNVNVSLPCSGVTTEIVSIQNNTTLVAEVFNANLPVTYQWTSGDTSQWIQTNGVSTFCVTITDALGCTATDCISVNPNCSMAVALDTLTNPGGITPTITNGTAPYSYQWSNNTTQSINYPTQAGNYCVVVTDAMGCSATACAWSNGSILCNYGFTFNTPNQGMATFYSYGSNNQPISWDFGDGSPIITSAAPQATHTFLTSGTYNVCMTIGNCAPFCTTVTINITNPCTNFTVNVLSYQNNTYIGAVTNNGTGWYSYQWTTGDTTQGIPTITGTSTYCVTVTDGLGCTATDCIFINPNCNINVNIINDSIAGTMTAIATNGSGNYYYLWSNGSNQSVITPTAVGNYCVTVDDGSGCSVTECSYWYGNNCNISANVITDSIGGTMTAYATNGTGPYTYLWNNASTQATITPTVTGNYCVTIYDASGCSASSCDYWYGTSCNYGFTQVSQTAGQVLFAAFGNNGQDIIWNFGDGSPIVISPLMQTTHTFLNSGTYNVCMTVANCAPFCATVVINLGNPCSSLTANITAYQNDSWLVVSASGGTWPFTYQWTTGDTSIGIATTMANTSYCVTVTDGVGCTVTDCITVNPGCTINAFVESDSLQGVMTAFASSGIAPFTYLWSNGSTQQIITPNNIGSYCVTITDAMGCTATDCAYWNGIYCNNGFTYTYQGPGEVVFITYGNNGQNATWNFGDGTAPLTSSASQLMHPYTVGGMYQVCMTVPGCNPVCMSVYVNLPGTSQICGNVFYDNNNNSVIDLGDAGIDSAYVYLWGGNLNQTAFTDAQGNYTFNNLNPGTYYVQFCIYNVVNYQGAAITVPAVDTSMCATYTVTIGANDTICGNNFGVYNNASEIAGTVFLDANSNGMMDPNESGLPYQLVQIGNNYTYSDWYGNYSIWLTPGNYTVSFTPSGNYSSGTVTTPSSYQINITAPGNLYSGNNFGIYMPPGMNDLSVVITPHTTVTPGFPAWYDINVCNYGSSATGATVTMIYDPALTTNYQTPAGIVNSANQTITWNIANINPNSCINIWTSFQALVGIQLGAGTLEFVMVTPTSGIDNNQANNTDTVHQTIVGSWDPNNKIVVRTNNTPDPSTHYISSVNADQEIVYTINFQNTGNAPAVNVVVIDEMAAELNTNSYQFINASHNCDINRIGNTVTYRFMNIMLPDSTNDEPNSHGFINFKINATNGLPMGTQIIDFANIYFDFNDPVLTNDAIVTLIDVTGVVNQNTSSVVIYPNPAQENFNVLFNSNLTGIANLLMYDNTGRKVLHTQTQINVGQNKTIINTNNLENGLYFIELIQPNGTILKNVISIQK